jgi:hypothetical protein
MIDRDMPQSLRELEDIARGSRRRGGTRNPLYVLDQSESDCTIQLAADTLTVGGQIRCIETTPFTVSEGFDLPSLPEVAEATRGDDRWAYWSQPVERPCVSWQQLIPLHRAHNPSSGHASLAALADHTLSRPSPEGG